MLSNALTQQRIHHAYLFTGTRGVGKTTLARIFAKSINCATGITPTPCGECNTCSAIDQGRFIDLYEVDAASRTKVEDTRELLENVMYPPNVGRFKVYLIDEVHMLSNHSFNALLKTLEEPPAHVKFLLATTDPKKLPITILSRCLQFHLKRITPEQIITHLQHICDAEQVTYELPALQQLAQAADGSMRDALSLLDQALAYAEDKKISLNDIYTMLGSLAQEDILPLLQHLSAKDGKQLFNALKQLRERGPDFQQVLETLLSLLHDIALYQIVPEAVNLNPALSSLAQQMTPEEVQLYYQIALLGRKDLSITPSPYQGFEVTLLRMFAFQPGQAKPIPLSTTDNPEKGQKPGLELVNAATKTTTPAANSSATPGAITQWRDLLDKLELSGLAQALANNCVLIDKTDNTINLALSIRHKPMLTAKLIERINESLTRYFNQPMQVNINLTDQEIDTPHKQQEQEKAQALHDAKKSILQDSQMQKLIKLYDATVEVSLLD
jgi:DNA polymerase-3 subunit gamma/tau